MKSMHQVYAICDDTTQPIFFMARTVYLRVADLSTKMLNTIINAYGKLHFIDTFSSILLMYYTNYLRIRRLKIFICVFLFFIGCCISRIVCIHIQLEQISFSWL
jgi:hypothetical protein